MSLFSIHLLDNLLCDMHERKCSEEVCHRPTLSKARTFDDRYEVRLELPGLDESELSLDVEGKTLSVKRKQEESNEAESQNGSPYTYKKFYIPDGVDVENISASMANGVLTIVLPIGENARPRSISIAKG